MVYVLMASWMAVSVDCAVIQDVISMPVCVIVTLHFMPRSVHVTCLRDGTLEGWMDCEFSDNCIFLSHYTCTTALISNYWCFHLSQVTERPFAIGRIPRTGRIVQ